MKNNHIFSISLSGITRNNFETELAAIAFRTGDDIAAVLSDEQCRDMARMTLSLAMLGLLSDHLPWLTRNELGMGTANAVNSIMSAGGIDVESMCRVSGTPQK
jgi:hypothetical protein